MMRTPSPLLASTVLRSGHVESARQPAWRQVQCGVGGPPAWDCPVPCRAFQTPQPMSPMSSGSAASSDQGRRADSEGVHTDDSPVRTGELLWAFKDGGGVRGHSLQARPHQWGPTSQSQKPPRLLQLRPRLHLRERGCGCPEVHPSTGWAKWGLPSLGTPTSILRKLILTNVSSG